MKVNRSPLCGTSSRILAAGVFGLVGLALAHRGWSYGQAISISGNTTYTQNFNTLGSGSVVWTNNSTLPGWYVGINDGFTAPGSLQPSNGTTDPNGLLNLGAAGAADRAIGSKSTSTGSFANIAYGVMFQNTTGERMRVSSISYAAELWRTNSGAIPEIWNTFYKTSAAPIFDLESGGSSATADRGTYIPLPALDWNSPNNSPASSALDGNLSFNRTVLTSFTNDIIIEPGNYFMFRWVDTNLANTDGHQGIDDVSINFTRYRLLAYNLEHTAGGAPNGSLVVGASPYWVESGIPSGLQTFDDVTFTQGGDATINVPANITLGTVFSDATFGTYIVGGPGRITGKFNKSNDGTIVLTSPNSFSSIFLAGGTVETRASGALGSTDIMLTSGSILKTTTVAQVHSGNLDPEISGGTVQTETDLTFTGGLNGTSLLVKAGPGMLTFNGTGIGNGGISIAGGTLRVNAFSTIGTNSQSIRLNGGTLEMPTTGTLFYNDTTTVSRNLYADFNGGTIAVPNTSLGNAVVIARPDTIIGDGTISKSGAGTLRITAAQTQFYGNWNINGGFLELQTTTGGLGTGEVMVNPTGTIVVQGLTLPNNVNLNGGALGTLNSDTTTYGGFVQVLVDSLVALRSSVSATLANSITITGVLSGSGGLTLSGTPSPAAGNVKALILKNSANTYSGTITIPSQQNLSSQPASGTGSTLGTASVLLRGGTLQIRDNGSASNGVVAYGTKIFTGLPTDILQPGISTLYVDRLNANFGNTIAMGTLTMGDHTLAFTGANGYRASFSGGTFNGNATLQTNGTTVPIFYGTYGGAGGFTKTGVGNLIFDGAAAFTGPTNINGGTLSLTGSLASSSQIDVKSGAIFDVTGVTDGLLVGTPQLLTGAGLIQGAVLVDGTVAPGAGIATLTFSTTLALDGIADFEIRKLSGVRTADLAMVSGALTLGGTLKVTALGDLLSLGDSFNLFDAATINGSFSDFDLPALPGNLVWDTDHLSVDGTLTVIPEPAGVALLIGGLGALVVRRRRK